MKREAPVGGYRNTPRVPKWLKIFICFLDGEWREGPTLCIALCSRVFGKEDGEMGGRAEGYIGEVLVVSEQ